MQKKVVIRSKWDRVRYTCSFELVLLLMLAPAGAMFFERNITDIGLLSLLVSIKAMVINLIYNWVFDSYEARAGKVSSDRGFAGRVVHAVGFEALLVLTSVPVLVWWLGLSVGQALLMDVMISGFVVVFNLFFTWAYDAMFPVEQSAPSAGGCSA